jgi:two-component system sensor histidine kinase/response regulator
MEGSIWVESQLGTGSTFQFTARFAIAPEQDAISAACAGRRALVVMPNEGERRHVLDQLHAWDVITTIADTTAAAQRAIEESDEPFSLVLLDYHLGSLEWIDSFTRLVRNKDVETTIALLVRTGTQHDSLDIDLRIFKPAPYAELLAAVDGSFKHEHLSAHNRQKAIAVNNRSLDVLLVEDTLANQRLVSVLLEKNGHTLTIANNGREALDLCEDHAFDVILMDVQMPIMDGITATEEIRQREIQTGAHIPIIAMTARAMQGDEERCREAGMDAYIAKPIRIQKLLDILQETVPIAAAMPATSAQATASNGDKNAELYRTMLEQTGEDEELLAELISYVLDSGPSLLAEVERAVEQRDAEQIQQIAHKLKGTVGVLGASPCFSAAEAVEHSGRNNELDSAGEKLENLKGEFSRYSEQLEGFLTHEPT